MLEQLTLIASVCAVVGCFLGRASVKVKIPTRNKLGRFVKVQ